MKDEFDAQDFCTVVFDEFFFTSIQNDNFVRHLMRLLWFVHPKVDATRLENVLKLIEPSSFGTPEAANDLMCKEYAALKEKIDEHLRTMAEAASAEEDGGGRVTDQII